MEVICAILTALFGIRFGILWRCIRKMPLPCAPQAVPRVSTEPTEEYIKLTRLEAS